MKQLFAVVTILLLTWTISDTRAQRKIAAEQTKQFTASRDTTLIESPKGKLGNSEGGTIFVGRTGQPENSKRRGLVAFNLAGIPPRSHILSVTLTMNLQLSAGSDESSPVTLYRVTRSWREGPSVAQGGRGADAKAGDATWIHNVYPSQRWGRPGGDYASMLMSAETSVGVTGPYTWNSTPRMVADVQTWVNSPNRNYGWIMIGDESKAPTAKVFHSSEATDESLRPQLTVTYTSSPHR
jgi:hypothetical protein